MSVDRTDYLFYGLDVGFGKVDYDRDEDIICGTPSPALSWLLGLRSERHVLSILRPICTQSKIWKTSPQTFERLIIGR